MVAILVVHVVHAGWDLRKQHVAPGRCLERMMSTTPKHRSHTTLGVCVCVDDLFWVVALVVAQHTEDDDGFEFVTVKVVEY